MAMTDYSVRGTGNICPTAMLATAVGAGATTLALVAFSSISITAPVVGSGVLVGNEIMKITEVAGMTITVSRGCADTVPTAHPIGRMLWFFDDAYGFDDREYAATETVGVKVLVKSASRQMGVENAPPNKLTFNSRFARPYPPGKVLVNGGPWYGQAALDADVEELVLTWAHRDRITQGDQLFGHELGNIGPEPGTQYEIEVFTNLGVSVALHTAITGTTYIYTAAQAITDLGAPDNLTTLGFLRLRSIRGDFQSWQSYKIDFKIVRVSGGWSLVWGTAWGG